MRLLIQLSSRQSPNLLLVCRRIMTGRDTPSSFIGEEKWGQATLLRALRGRPRVRRKWCQEQFFLSLAFVLIAQEIVDDLEAALEQFRLIANDLSSDTSEKVT